MGKAIYFSEKEIEVLKLMMDFVASQVNSSDFEDEESYEKVTTKISNA